MMTGALLKTKVAVDVRLATRLAVIEEFCRSVYSIVSDSTSLELSFQQELQWLSTRIQGKLVEALAIDFHENDRIIARLTVKIDWSQHSLEMSLGHSHIRIDASDGSSLTRGMIDQFRLFAEVIASVDQTSVLTAIKSYYTPNRAAIRLYGLDHVRKLANLCAMSEEEKRHRASFSADDAGTYASSEVSELGMTMAVGMSEPLAVFRQGAPR